MVKKYIYFKLKKTYLKVKDLVTAFLIQKLKLLMKREEVEFISVNIVLYHNWDRHVRMLCCLYITHVLTKTKQ